MYACIATISHRCAHVMCTLKQFHIIFVCQFLKDTDYQTAVKNAVRQVSEYNGKLLNNRWTNYYDGQTRVCSVLELILSVECADIAVCTYVMHM